MAINCLGGNGRGYDRCDRRCAGGVAGAVAQGRGYVEAEEGVVNRLAGWAGLSVTAIAVAMTLFHLYAAYDIVPTQPLRYTHVAFVMVLCFLSFPLTERFRNRVEWFDVIAAAASVAILVYAIWGGEDFTDRDHAHPARRHARRDLHCAAARGDASHQRLDHAVRRDSIHRLRDDRPLPAAAVDAPRL